ncbi:solute carrier family 22 member 16 [Carlito syrichta]|uniref:Solute carrier family 22 member 16 n=1 Tax=Carlito syrichta TaxID=1868482 RepID=A0A1U7UPH0_CARSF|nr:solute carrier family 22 member 16 [Carlito syrichta]
MPRRGQRLSPGNPFLESIPGKPKRMSLACSVRSAWVVFLTTHCQHLQLGKLDCFYEIPLIPGTKKSVSEKTVSKFYLKCAFLQEHNFYFLIIVLRFRNEMKNGFRFSNDYINSGQWSPTFLASDVRSQPAEREEWGAVDGPGYASGNLACGAGPAGVGFLRVVSVNFFFCGSVSPAMGTAVSCIYASVVLEGIWVECLDDTFEEQQSIKEKDLLIGTQSPSLAARPQETPSRVLFQIFLYFMCAFQNISCGVHYLASVFMVVTPQHTCRPPGNLNNGEVWELSRCSRSRRENTSSLDYEYSGSKEKFPCVDGYIYDQRKWQSTVVTEWNLVCDHKWLGMLVQPLFMFGVLLGSVIFGYISDRLGRRLVLWLTSSGMFLFGMAVAFTINYYSFMAARFFLAMAASGYLVVGFVYVMEFIGVKFRTWASMHLHSFFAVGTLVVALTGYLVRTWWLYQMILSTVTVPFLLCCWMLPETPFWLLSEGRCREAQYIVDVIAKWNGVGSCKLSELLSLDPQDPVGNNSLEGKKFNLLYLFHDWTVTKRTLTVWLIWFTGSLGFYSFSLNSVNLGGSAYLNLFLMGAVEIPAYTLMCLVMGKVGRRTILASALFFSALACGVIMVIPPRYYVWSVVTTMAGKFAIGAVFGLIYLYTAELYPTIVRSLAVGSGSMVCRVASITAPLSVDLRSIWIFIPQLSVGIMSFLSGVLTLRLPETLGKPLATTWEEAAKLEAENDSTSRKLLPTADNIVLEKVDVINPQDPGLGE